MPITINIPHQLGRAEARSRLQTGLENVVRHLPGATSVARQTWEGDRLTFRIEALGQSIAGLVEVFDTVVTMNIELPGVLGVIAGGLKERIRRAGQLLLSSK